MELGDDRNTDASGWSVGGVGADLRIGRALPVPDAGPGRLRMDDPGVDGGLGIVEQRVVNARNVQPSYAQCYGGFEKKE